MPLFRSHASHNSDYKNSVRAALRSNLNLNANVTVIDGVTLENNDRVLLVGQTDSTQNGIYSWNDSTLRLSRAFDADSSREISAGTRVYVDEGNTLARSIWVVVSTGSLSIGSTPIIFSKDGIVNEDVIETGTYGSGSLIPVITVDESGEILAVTEQAVVSPHSAGSGIVINNNVISVNTATVVTVSGTQTITNKTLTSPNINNATIDNTSIDGGTF